MLGKVSASCFNFSVDRVVRVVGERAGVSSWYRWGWA